jgi:hypothetical protein
VFANKNAATGKTVSASGVTLKDSTGTDVTDNYSITYADNTSSSIAQADYTMITASKTYDGTAVFSAVTLVGVNGEAFSVGQATADSKNASSNAGASRLSSTNGILSGITANDDTANYNSLDLDLIGSNTASIAQAALTVTATQASKTYDGTTSASGVGSVAALAGAGAGETVLSYGSQVFANKNVGTGKTVIASGVTLQDADATDVTGNYSITYLDNTSSSITAGSSVESAWAAQDAARLSGTAKRKLLPLDPDTVPVGLIRVGGLVLVPTQARADAASATQASPVEVSLRDAGLVPLRIIYR